MSAPRDEVVRRIEATVSNQPTADAVTALLGELPDPSSLPDGGWLEVCVAPAKRSFWSRWRPPRSAGPHPALAVACTALLSAGYEAVRSDGARAAFGRARGGHQA